MLKKLLYISFSLILIVFFWFVNSTPVFKGYSNTFTVYLNSASSLSKPITVTDNDLPFIFSKKGESFSTSIKNLSVESIFSAFSAEMIFTESTKDVICYYGFSKKIKYRAYVSGAVVNLHVSVSKTTVSVGTPLIFGSF